MLNKQMLKENPMNRLALKRGINICIEINQSFVIYFMVNLNQLSFAPNVNVFLSLLIRF